MNRDIIVEGGKSFNPLLPFEIEMSSMSGFVSSLHPLALKQRKAFPFRFQSTMATSSVPTTQPKVSLYSMPVSNYSARVRYLIKRKKLPEGIVNICPPSDLGGLKGVDYLKLNPLGKMPAAFIHAQSGKPEQCLYESSVICEYMADAFSSEKPSFIPDTPETRARAKLIANLLDIYVGPLHPFMYKKLAVSYEDRMEGVKSMNKGFDAIEHAMDEEGPYAAGAVLSIADCCLWGNWPFYDFMLPTFFACSPTDGRPKLRAWADYMQKESPAAREVYAEVFGGLLKWWDNDRWVKLGMSARTSRPEMSF